MASFADYIPRGAMLYTPMDDGRKSRYTDTVTNRYILGLEEKGPIGSQKSFKLGDTQLKMLGIDRYDVIKLKGKEPLVKFSVKDVEHKGPKGVISFFQKSENKEMKSFIKILKSLAEDGIELKDFKHVKNMLKLIHK
ncbi:hypothetical protein J6E39_09610 [bacterium]|nr:hypothetical protein [bacterium]